MIRRAEATHDNFYQVLETGKSLAREMKENYLKPLSSIDLGRKIPDRKVADQLVQNYMRTFEGTLRILHMPTFYASYESYWNGHQKSCDAFIIQMQLCMSLGSIFYDDVFSMRPSATQWIHEAQLWLLLPPEKSKMTIDSIQIMCLLILAKLTCGVGHAHAWNLAGSLIRQAMGIGLHRDPSHMGTMTTYQAELRRRLWATILELNLQCSFEASGTPFSSTLTTIQSGPQISMMTS